MSFQRIPVGAAFSKYNNDPGSGRTGYWDIPPNNYDFYTEEEKYVPNILPDGAICSNWEPLYHEVASDEQKEKDRKAAFEKGVPHGWVAEGEKYKGQATIKLLIKSELHKDEEYGGPFYLDVSPKMKVHDLRGLIRDTCGIMPGMQKLSYAGKNMEDPERTLEHYGIKYWHAKFPGWPVIIRRHNG